MNEHTSHNPNRQKKHTISNKVRNRLVAVATAAPLLLLAACSSPDQTSAAPDRGHTAETSLTPTLEQTKEKLKSGAVDAAISVLDILADPNAGAENYVVDDYSLIGNKAALIGPDLVWPSADDTKYRKYPESLASFSPETRTVIVRAVAMYGDTANPVFSSVETRFLVGEDNPILTETGVLTTTDFTQALLGEDVEVVSASAQNEYSYGKTVDANTGYSAGLDFEGDVLVGELDGAPLETEVIKDPNQLFGLAGELSDTLHSVAAQLEADTK